MKLSKFNFLDLRKKLSENKIIISLIFFKILTTGIIFLFNSPYYYADDSWYHIGTIEYFKRKIESFGAANTEISRPVLFYDYNVFHYILAMISILLNISSLQIYILTSFFFQILPKGFRTCLEGLLKGVLKIIPLLSQ